MPDINYECETAFAEMEKVIDFYAGVGVDGFRVDAIAHIAKDLTFKDARDKNATYKSFSNLTLTHTYLKRFNKAFTKNHLVTMGELGGEPKHKDLIKYTTEKELDMIFSFEHIEALTSKHKINTRRLLNTLKYKEEISSENGWSVLFWLNHDYPRLISKVDGELDPKNAQICLATLMYMLKGTPVIYNGEEIGMTNYHFESPDELHDVNAKMILDNAKNKEKAFIKLKDRTRDHSRTCMQWDSKKYAGFSTATPWFYVNNNYKECNVAKAMKDSDSMYSHYTRIISIRNEYGDSLVGAKYDFYRKSGVLGYKIQCDGVVLEVVANLSKKDKPMTTMGKEVLYSNMPLSDTLHRYQVAILKYID